MQGVAFQTVCECAVDGVALDVVAANDEGVTISHTEDVGCTAFGCHVFNIRETALPFVVSTAALSFVEEFDAVLLIPVAGDNHLSTVEFQG